MYRKEIVYVSSVGISVKEKEFASHLAGINGRRSLYSAIVLTVLIPVWYAFLKLSGMGMRAEGITAYVIVAELVQILAIPLMLVLIKRNETDRLLVSYKVYYLISTALLMAIGVQDMKATGSSMMYVGALGYYVFVPVFNKKEHQYFHGAVIAAGVIAGFMVWNTSGRAVLDVLVYTLAAIVMGRYNSASARRYEKVREELRQKTISSEQDPLTGLTNRRGLARRANVLWPYCSRSKTSVGIIAIDVDFFKKYNDKYGHPEGDKCLKRIAEAIRQAARRGTDIAARTGGEEFLVFVQDMTNEEMIALALKIRENIAALQIPHAYVGVSNYVTVSMGVAITQPTGMNNFHELYEEADQALYTAKYNGRNCVVCEGLLYGRMKNGLGTVING